MCERAFVIIPLLEIDRSINIPGRLRAACFESAVAGQGITRL
jgi:2-amino-4-hydroxy-6-hydroxymethyldihydropteridine diphosphokinase